MVERGFRDRSRFSKERACHITLKIKRVDRLVAPPQKVQEKESENIAKSLPHKERM